MTEDSSSAPTPLLRHVVLFAFNDMVTPQRLKEIEDTFRALPEQIEEIHALEGGADVSVENLTRGFSHCFLVTFLSEADRNAYLPHPAHQEFVRLVEPYANKVLVVDYWVEGSQRGLKVKS
jgi:hypothetical protein